MKSELMCVEWRVLNSRRREFFIELPVYQKAILWKITGLQALFCVQNGFGIICLCLCWSTSYNVLVKKDTKKISISSPSERCHAFVTDSRDLHSLWKSLFWYQKTQKSSRNQEIGTTKSTENVTLTVCLADYLHKNAWKWSAASFRKRNIGHFRSKMENQGWRWSTLLHTPRISFRVQICMVMNKAGIADFESLRVLVDLFTPS